MFESVARSGTDSDDSPSPKNSTNLPTTPWARSISVSVSTRSVALVPGGRARTARLPITVARILELDVALGRLGRAEHIHLHAVADHQIDGDQRIHRGGTGSGPVGGAPHRREVDDGRDAGEVLHEHAGRHEGDVAGRV